MFPSSYILLFVHALRVFLSPGLCTPLFVYARFASSLSAAPNQWQRLVQELPSNKQLDLLCLSESMSLQSLSFGDSRRLPNFLSQLRQRQRSQSASSAERPSVTAGAGAGRAWQQHLTATGHRIMARSLLFLFRGTASRAWHHHEIVTAMGSVIGNVIERRRARHEFSRRTHMVAMYVWLKIASRDTNPTGTN